MVQLAHFDAHQSLERKPTTSDLSAGAGRRAGCRLRELRTPETQLRPLGAKPQAYASAAITYRLQPPPPAGGDVELASYSTQPVASQTAAPSRTQILSIEYPHPAGRRGYALAEVIVAREAASDAANRSGSWLAAMRRVARDRMPGLTYAEGIQSAWALDVPIAEVDLLIRRLDAQGYFADSKAPLAGADLAARIDGRSFSKPWSSVPELNTLVRNVRRQGKLVSHREPLELPSPSQPIEPVIAAVYTTSADSPAIDVCERLPPVD